MKNALIAAASLAAIAAVVPAAAPTQAWAQDATANAGAYANLNLGIGSYGSADVKAVQGRLGYRFNDWVGVEGELATGIDSDKDTIAGTRVKQTLKHEAAAYVVGFAPIAANTDLIARIGYGATKAKVSAAGVSASDSQESINYGVGAQHHFDGVNGIRADFTRQEFRHDGGHANVWTVGYSRKF